MAELELSSNMRPRRLWLVLTVALALMGLVLILFHTRNGPGITGDSVHYVMGAENLLDGRGYARTSGGGEAIPITAFPPGYSWVLAAGGLLTDDLFEIGRWLSGLLFGATIGLTSLIVYQQISKLAPAIFAAGLIILSEDLIQIFSWVMSEPVFIVLMLLAVLGLSRYLETGQRGILIASAILAVASTLVRYVGLSLLGASVIAILILGRGKLLRRFIDSVVFASISAIPLVLWFSRNAALGGSLTNRALGFHPLPGDLGLVFLGTANAWFFPLTLGLPKEVRGLMSVAIVAIFLGWLLYSGWKQAEHSKRNGAKRWALAWVLIIVISTYLIALIFNTSFFDASTTRFGAARYLTPILVLSIILLTVTGARLLEKFRANRLVIGLISALGLFILSTYAIRAVQVLNDPGKAFRYTDIKNDRPDLVATLRELGQDRPLISNDIELIYVLADRPAYRFPIEYDHYQQAVRDDLDEQIQFTREQLNDGGVIVLFDAAALDAELEIVQLLGAIPLLEFEGAYFFSGQNYD
jgi:hypothetical protein